MKNNETCCFYFTDQRYTIDTYYDMHIYKFQYTEWSKSRFTLCHSVKKSVSMVNNQHSSDHSDLSRDMRKHLTMPCANQVSECKDHEINRSFSKLFTMHIKFDG